MNKVLMLLPALVLFAGCVIPQSWNPPDSARFRDAEAKYLAGDFRTAADAFAAIADTPDFNERAIARYWEGNARLEIGDFAAAEEAFTEAMAEKPPEFFKGSALLGMGRACIGLQRFADAAAHFSRAISEAPGALRGDFAHLLLGTACLRSGRWDEGVRNLETAAALGKDSDSAAEANASLAFAEVRKFTIQTGAYSVKTLADSEAERLKAAGLDAWIHTLPGLEGKDPMYAVCVGKFDGWPAAVEEASRLRGRGLILDSAVKP